MLHPDFKKLIDEHKHLMNRYVRSEEEYNFLIKQESRLLSKMEVFKKLHPNYNNYI